MRTWTCLAGLIALLLGLIPCPVSAAPSAYHLSKVVMLTRHGVAAPADDNQLPRITGKAWPQWPVGPGQLSPRGAQLLTAQWASLRALYLEAGLLPAQKTESRVFVRADNTPRSRGSAEALLRGLTPGTLPSYAVVNLDPDSLFEPVQAGLAIFDPAETALSVLDHINGDFSQFWESLGEPMSLLDQLTGPLSSETCNSINLLTPYRIDSEMMRKTGNERCAFLHCLPSFHNRDTIIGEKMYQRFGLECMEVSDEVFESPNSLVFAEAANRMHTIKAVMVATLADVPDDFVKQGSL